VSGVKAARMGWLVGGTLAAAVACSDHPRSVKWVKTGARAAFPSPLTVDQATAIAIDAAYLYWITKDGFLYRVPRSAGEVERVSLSAQGEHLAATNDIYVGWTEGSGSTAIAAVADIDASIGTVTAMKHQPGVLRGLVGGRHGYSFAVVGPDGTRVQTCLDGVCPEPSDIESAYKSLALDLTTKTFYVLAADGFRTCSLSHGCPHEAATTPAETTLVATMPGSYFLLDTNGQVLGNDGSLTLGSAAAPDPTKFMVDDGNGRITTPIGTWSNGSQLAQCPLAPATATTQFAMACTDFDVDPTGRPIYCLSGSSSIQVIR
jgi:hypothetical protein